MWGRRPAYTGPERRKARRWQPRRGRFLLLCFLLVAVGYIGAVLWLMAQETRLVFQASTTLGPARPAMPFESIELPRPDGARQFGWVMRRGGTDQGTWVLYLHGNAATIGSQVNISHYNGLVHLGLNVFAPEYRGFGGLDGVPTEDALAADARAAYDYLRATRGIPPDRIVLYGWSLGAAVAVRLASDTEQAAVVLEGAPASLAAIRQQRYPLFPIRLIMRNPFEAIDRIDRVRAPLLFLHSPADEVIPISEGRRLFDAARAPKTFVEIKGGHVQAIDVDAERVLESLRAFFAEHGLLGDGRTAAASAR
jgi:fermentation-respiration switch protein FrsA (DUF1100 family)